MEQDPKILSLPAVPKLVEKPARPAHVIVLADLITRLTDVTELDALVVCWSYPEGDEGSSRIGCQTLGAAADTHLLASRFCSLVLAGQLNERNLPVDR